ncbi:hypothetical protein N2152v2_007085 [Parachlorella kessleri]
MGAAHLAGRPAHTSSLACGSLLSSSRSLLHYHIRLNKTSFSLLRRVENGQQQRQQQRQMRPQLSVLPRAQVLTLPTILTLLRVAAIPALVWVWYSSAPWAPLACTALFVGASLTDFLDGYLARKLNVASAFGAFLDPVADKLMVATVLILLSTRPVPAGVAAGSTWLLPCLTCAIIGREITMSALREWAAALGPEAHKAVAVSWMGKWKTACQMVSVTLLLAAQQAGAGGLASLGTAGRAAGAAGVPLLALATLLTVWSLCDYFVGLWRFMV